MSVNLLVANSQSNVEKGLPVFEGSYNVPSGETSDPIMLPDKEGPRDFWQVQIVTAGNTGRFETSISPRETIKAGGGNWSAWSSGNVITTTGESLTPVQAVRIVSVTGAVTGEVLVL